MEKLKQKYELICDEYINVFCVKQEMDFEGWVGNIVGGGACCNDFFFDFQDIVYDINTRQPQGLIVNWYYYNLELKDGNINYHSYAKGLRL